jgi:O-antigen/teichoic acid export membrane protein
MGAQLLARRWRRPGDPLLRSAYSLMANTVLTSALGVAFWIIAARDYPTELVGRDSALISSMLTLSLVCQLNAGNALLRFLPTLGDRAVRAVLGTYAGAAVASLVGASAFVLAAPAITSEFGFLRDEPVLALAFVLGTTLWSVFQLQDSALTALRQPEWVPVENTLYGVLKIAALPLFAAVLLDVGVFLSWVVPMTLLLVPVNLIVFRYALPRHRRLQQDRVVPARTAGRRRLATFLAQDYLGAILNVASMNLLPVLVLALLGAEANAYFYMPFLIVAAFDLLFTNITAALTVEGAFAESRLPELVDRVVRRFGLLLLAAVPLAVIAAPLLLLPFGPEYSSGGTTVLRILVLAAAFRAVLALFTAVCRVRRRAAPLAVMQAVLSAVLLVLAVVLSEPLGTEGIALAWLAANALVALAVLPLLRRALAQVEP